MPCFATIALLFESMIVLLCSIVFVPCTFFYKYKKIRKELYFWSFLFCTDSGTISSNGGQTEGNSPSQLIEHKLEDIPELSDSDNENSSENNEAITLNDSIKKRLFSPSLIISFLLRILFVVNIWYITGFFSVTFFMIYIVYLTINK